MIDDQLYYHRVFLVPALCPATRKNKTVSILGVWYSTSIIIIVILIDTIVITVVYTHRLLSNLVKSNDFPPHFALHGPSFLQLSHNPWGTKKKNSISRLIDMLNFML